MSKILIDEATAKQVLAVLEGVWKGGFSFPTLDRIRQAITAMREALAEQPAQQEPVAWMTQARCFVDLSEFTEAEAKLFGWKPVYTSPPAQRTWVGLTDEEIERIFNNWPTYHLDHEEFARAIEAKLKEKNT